MPTARSASGRRAPAASTSASALTTAAMATTTEDPDVIPPQLSTGLQSAYSNLLGYVNGMRKCCDMAKFYQHVHMQGDDFIADSIQHANDIFASYASASKIHDSPTKMAGEMLKTPSRRKDAPRTRRAAANVAALRLKAYEKSPVVADRRGKDRSDKENLPASGRLGDDALQLTNPLQQKLLEAKERSAKGKAKAIVAVTPLGEINGSNGNIKKRSAAISCDNGDDLDDDDVSDAGQPTPKLPARRALGEISVSIVNSRAGQGPSSEGPDRVLTAKGRSVSSSTAARAQPLPSSSSSYSSAKAGNGETALPPLPSSSSSSTKQNEATATAKASTEASAKRLPKAAAVTAPTQPEDVVVVVIDNSMEIDQTMVGGASSSLVDRTMPRASTPPPPSTSPQKPATRGITATVSIDDLQPIGDASTSDTSELAVSASEEERRRSHVEVDAGEVHLQPTVEKAIDTEDVIDAVSEEMEEEENEEAVEVVERAQDKATVSETGQRAPASAEDSEGAADEADEDEEASSAERTAVTAEQDLSVIAEDEPAAAEASSKVSKADAARKSAAALLASKLQQQQQQQQDAGAHANTEKPAKRTLSSFSAKKSLSTNAAAALNAAAVANANLPALPASTPAGPSFRSSFLNKSLRKRVEDSQTRDKVLNDDDEEEDDDDEDRDGASDVEGAVTTAASASAGAAKATAAATEAKAGKGMSKVQLAMASMTKSNTRTNATHDTPAPAAAASRSATGTKRKSNESHTPDAADPADRNSPPSAKIAKAAAAVSRLGSSKTPGHTATSTSDAPTPATAAKARPAASGPASKLEMFRNNLATVTRNGGGGAGAGGARGGVPLASSSAFAHHVSASSPSKALPPIPIAAALVPTSDPITSRDAATATSSSDAPLSKLYPSLPEAAVSPTRLQQQQQQAKLAAAVAKGAAVESISSPLSPKSPSLLGKAIPTATDAATAASTSPVRLSPRNASIRNSPNKSPERSRFGSPYRSLRNGGGASKGSEPTSPTGATAGSRTLASLFGTATYSGAGSRLPQRLPVSATGAVPAGSTTPMSSPVPKVLRAASKAMPPPPPVHSEETAGIDKPKASEAMVGVPVKARHTSRSSASQSASSDGGERRQTRQSAAKAKEAEQLQQQAAAAAASDPSDSQAVLSQATQSRTQPATQFFDALSQKADASNEKTTEIDNDDVAMASVAAADEESSDSEGELTLEELSKGKIKGQPQLQPQPQQHKEREDASAQRSKQQPQQTKQGQHQPTASSSRKEAGAPAIAVVIPSPRKATNPALASSTQAQQGRLNGSIRGAAPPSAPNGRAMAQKQADGGPLNSSVNGKFASSKLPTSSQPSSSSSATGSGSDPASNGQAGGTNSSGWGFGARLKGLFGLQSSTSGAAAGGTAAPSSGGSSSASSGFMPRPRTMSISQNNNGLGNSISAAATAAASQQQHQQGSQSQESSRLNASQTSTSTASSAAAIVGKPASLARAEMLRRKEAEEAERKAKERDERKRMVLAAKEKRAKAAQEEEQEKEKRKRAREDNDRAKRLADVSEALPPVAAAGGAPHAGRGSTAFNAASVKSRYLAGSTNAAPTSTAIGSGNAAVSDNGKKRRLTTDRDGNVPAAAPAMAAAAIPSVLLSKPQQDQQQGQQGQGQRQRAGSVGTQGAPKLTHTVSQTSIRGGPGGAPSQPAVGTTNFKSSTNAAPSMAGSTVNSSNGVARPGLHAAGQPIRFGSATPSSSSTAKAAAAAAASASASAAAQQKRTSNFSAQNPFQQQQILKQQQAQQQQLQKQRQLQAQEAANARAAMAAAQYKEAYAAEERDRERAREKEKEEELPDVNSEYSDSDNEETVARRATHPAWTQGSPLQHALLAQATIDADEIFGIPSGPVKLEEMLPSATSQVRIRRPRSSSANWSGPDGLAQWEIDRYNRRLGIRSGGVPPGGNAGAGPGAGRKEEKGK